MGLRQQETLKYKRVWNEIPGYGNYSPADVVIGPMLGLLAKHNVKTVLDAGCGSGKALKKLLDAGYDAKGVDITLDGLIDKSLVKNCVATTLWDIPLKEGYDAVICIDIMEHIPTTKVRDVLRELSRLCKGFAIFQIALQPDGYGKAIDDVLHLSLFKPEDWTARLNRHFNSVKMFECTPQYVSFACINDPGAIGK